MDDWEMRRVEGNARMLAKTVLLALRLRRAGREEEAVRKIKDAVDFARRVGLPAPKL